MDDMTRTQYVLGQNCEPVLDSIFSKNTPIVVNPEGKIETDIPIKRVPSFAFSSKEITLFSDKIETHVGNIHPKKKALLLTFRKFLNKNRKNYETIKNPFKVRVNYFDEMGGFPSVDLVSKKMMEIGL